MTSGIAGAQDSLPLSYVGSNARIGVGIDQEGTIQGEALGVLGYNGSRALLVQGWLGGSGAGGVQADYHWLWDTSSQKSPVTKLFLALDQNGFDDRKASVGVGLERNAYAFDAYLSRALTDERFISSAESSVTERVTGEDNGRPFRQDVTVDTLTERFEHPYEQGIGLRVARFFDEPLVRIRGGLDYERGSALLEAATANQLSFSLGVEKQLKESPHSFAVELEHLRKDGPFDTPAFGGKRDDTRAMLTWHYDFGQAFRPQVTYREKKIVHTVPAPAPKPEIRRTELQLSSQALFEFNRADVTAAAKASLHDLVAQLKTRRVGTIEVVGHTCDLGSDAYNQRLSERRAASVRDWLISEGVPADAILASGKGEQSPLLPNDSEQNRARNRRITMTFMAVAETAIAKEATPEATTTEIVREAITAPPAWIERALRTPANHKRVVDTYRSERVTQTRTEGARVFLNRPQAANDSVTTTVDSPVTIAVLANDSDADGETLEIAEIGTPANGSVVKNPNGTLTYTPAAGFIGVNTFTYTVRDPGGLAATATVSVTVAAAPEPENRAPVASNDAVTVMSGTSATVAVLDNDSDPDGDDLTVSVAAPPAHGTATVDADGRIVYVANAGFTGADTITYTVRDPEGLTATATVNVTVVPVNHAPVPVDDFEDIANTQDTPFIDIQVLNNDSDPDPSDAGRLTVIGVSAVTLVPGTQTAPTGTVAISADGKSIRFTAGFDPGLLTHDETFTYTIQDPGGLTRSATVFIFINGG